MVNVQWSMDRVGLSPQPLVSVRLIVVTAVATASGVATSVSTGIAALAATTAVGGLGAIAAKQRLGIHKLGLLQELTTRDIHLLLLLRHESDVERLQVLAHIKLVLLQGAAGLILQGSEEGTQSVDLHSLALQQHLHQAATELLQHTKYYILRINATVLADVLCQLAGVQGFNTLAVGEPLAKYLRLVVLVLSQLIKNLRHTLILMIFARLCRLAPPRMVNTNVNYSRVSQSTCALCFFLTMQRYK